jgi:hypothetical protein
MKRLLLSIAVVGACSAAQAGVVLHVPSQTQQTPSTQYDFPIDLSFQVTSPTTSQTLVGYNLALKVTTSGGAGFSIVGVGAGSDRPANSVFNSNPVYFVQTDPEAGTLYTFVDYLDSGSGTIIDGSSLLRVKARLQPGAIGTYHIDVFATPTSPLGSTFYSGIDGDGYPIVIGGMTYEGGTIQILIPEPGTLVLLGVCTLFAAALGLWRRHKNCLSYSSISRSVQAMLVLGLVLGAWAGVANAFLTPDGDVAYIWPGSGQTLAAAAQSPFTNA